MGKRGKIIIEGELIPGLDEIGIGHLSSSLSSGVCTLCGEYSFEEAGMGSECPNCSRRTRQRSLPIIAEVLKPLIDKNKDGELLAFALTGIENDHIGSHFKSIFSASLYGNYGQKHTSGVDVRDLSRFESSRFSAFFSSLLFDYFVEHREALNEIFRVLRKGGIFVTHIAEGRILEGDVEPNLHKLIRSKPGSFEYLGECEIPSIKVGKKWLLGCMKQCGFQSCAIEIYDSGNGERITWFIGKKGE